MIGTGRGVVGLVRLCGATISSKLCSWSSVSTGSSTLCLLLLELKLASSAASLNFVLATTGASTAFSTFFSPFSSLSPTFSFRLSTSGASLLSSCSTVFDFLLSGSPSCSCSSSSSLSRFSKPGCEEERLASSSKSANLLTLTDCLTTFLLVPPASSSTLLLTPCCFSSSSLVSSLSAGLESSEPSFSSASDLALFWVGLSDVLSSTTCSLSGTFLSGASFTRILVFSTLFNLLASSSFSSSF